jgi:NADH dehydrogenase/NADH:ubiquinone oxidoreductase subunit G
VADTFEIHGSFVTGKGLTQAFEPTLLPPDGIEPAWKTIAELAGKLGKDLGIENIQGLREGLVDAVEAAQ